jgi:ABC-type amino acid transport substrate-binding protein
MAAASIGALVCLLAVGAASRLYLASTTLAYDLDKQFLALEINEPYGEVVVYRSRADLPDRSAPDGSTLDRIKTDQLLRVGYHPDHLPSSFFNSQGHLVGLDVELMHRLAERLQVKLEFVPYAYDTVVDQLASGEIDVAVGGLVMKPERLLRAGFTQPYQTATISIVIPDHRRSEVDTWDKVGESTGLRFGAVHEDVSAAARRRLPNLDMVVIDSVRSYFAGERDDLDGLLMSAEAAAAWNILYPRHAVVVPQPIVQRPVGMAVRLSDDQWLRFLDRWLDFERLDGSLERLRVYWVEGGGTKRKTPRWSVLRNVLGWIP